ncbi:MAG: class I SAM-dependent methyltransferase, partial [Erysipelotrichaceae bacterium]|nr:class I SAM-dependent methyltransferase [Erysipelotrichaceae bacterium]
MYHRNEFGKYYQDHFKTGLGVEVGVQNGYFSIEILRNWKGELKCVDRWIEPDQEKNAELNLGRERMIKGDSVKSAELFKDESLDFVFIDAGHRYEEVKADIEAWYPKVRKGGIVSGHDYINYQDFGVIKA